MKVHLRADADFGLPVMMKCCEEEGFPCTFDLRSNARLKKIAWPLNNPG